MSDKIARARRHDALLCEALDLREAELERVKLELFHLYKTLQSHGIVIDQVDKDADGRDLWRWILRSPETGASEQSIERWRSPHKALNAALTALLED